MDRRRRHGTRQHSGGRSPELSAKVTGLGRNCTKQRPIELPFGLHLLFESFFLLLFSCGYSDYRPSFWRRRVLRFVQRFREPSPAPERPSCCLAVYLLSQLTSLFQSTKAPLGLSRQAQTCSSKCAGKPYRFGLLTNWNVWPSSTGGLS